MKRVLLPAVAMTALLALPVKAQMHGGGDHREHVQHLMALHHAAAQHGPSGHLSVQHDALEQHLFAPDFVLQHASAIGLEAAQRTEIANAMKAAHGEMLDLHLQMTDRSGELLKLVGAARVDENAVLAQVDRVMALEREMKRKQMQLLIRIKNTLSQEQQDRLRELRKRDG
ncbi:MAG: Spy/CpxP family protein refolding chaperone [Gemmatimonadales bacterium]